MTRSMPVLLAALVAISTAACESKQENLNEAAEHRQEAAQEAASGDMEDAGEETAEAREEEREAGMTPGADSVKPDSMAAPAQP
jgi:hypothetical protein